MLIVTVRVAFSVVFASPFKAPFHHIGHPLAGETLFSHVGSINKRDIFVNVEKVKIQRFIVDWNFKCWSKFSRHVFSHVRAKVQYGNDRQARERLGAEDLAGIV